MGPEYHFEGRGGVPVAASRIHHVTIENDYLLDTVRSRLGITEMVIDFLSLQVTVERRDVRCKRCSRHQSKLSQNQNTARDQGKKIVYSCHECTQSLIFAVS